MSCLFVLPPPTLYLLLCDIYLEAQSWKAFLCRKNPPPSNSPLVHIKMQVKRGFPLHVGVGGGGGVDEGRLCVCGIDDRYICYVQYYKLRFCTSCNLYKQFVQVATRTRLAVQVVTCTEFHYQINPTCTILLYKLDLKRILVKLTILLKL